MTTSRNAASARRVAASAREGTGAFLRVLEVDTRLLGMIAALVVIWIGFSIASDGLFLSPRNLWNLSVQTATVAVMATGMVLIIVSRNIDLSVGSMMAIIGTSMSLLQTEWLPTSLGLGLNQPYTWIVAVAFGIGMGVLIGALHGVLIAYVGIPSFIVTLGGLLAWRGAMLHLTGGRTLAPMDPTFQLLGGGYKGSVGETVSWIIGIIVCAGIVYMLISGRRRRRRYGFPVRPMWAEALLGIAGCAAVLWAVWVANSYPWPERIATQYAQEHGITEPPGGLLIGHGIANPVLLALGVALVITIVATRRRFGRYVFAIGGNPEAAELSGINTRRIVMLTFVIMGALAAISAVIATARLNASEATLGTGAELEVIAAAVIGGTSFAGGIGTIPGAVLGALVVQSLVSGMQLLRVDNAVIDIAVGIVLVLAVGIDTVIRRRAS
jgi:D-xylose transport system permease protein